MKSEKLMNKRCFGMSLLLVVSLAGCFGEENSDLKEWMRQNSEGLHGKVEPLPAVKPYEPFPYNASDVADPFKPAKMDVAKGKGALIPNVNRPREPLESYDLEKLQMAGTLQQGKTIQALIKAPDGTLHRVRQGSYLGRNFGMVVRIGETEVTLKEIVEDSGGDWVERTSSLTLEEVEQNAQKVGQKK